MRPIISFLALGTALGLAQAATAQQAVRGDAATVEYCRALARAYTSQNPVQSSPNASDAMLADNCAGDTQATTAMLKRKLADHGIDLPAPPTVAGGAGTGRAIQ